MNILGALFGQPERSFYASELIRDDGTGSGAAQRELARLEASGLIVARRIGHQKHYQANAASPLYSELRNIVLNTVGLAEPLRNALNPLSSAIRAAFVYGYPPRHVHAYRDGTLIAKGDLDNQKAMKGAATRRILGSDQRTGR